MDRRVLDVSDVDVDGLFDLRDALDYLLVAVAERDGIIEALDAFHDAVDQVLVLNVEVAT
jgi:hypothetical protein